MYAFNPGVRKPSPLARNHAEFPTSEWTHAPIGFAGGQWNLTAYCDNDPVNYKDRNGMVAAGNGHHWVPRDAFTNITGGLPKAVMRVFENGTSGKLPYVHRVDEWNGIPHTGKGSYSESVKKTSSNIT
jgi:hypothetical protein